MTENELLLAISNIVDQKIKDNLKPLQNDISNIKDDISNIKDDINNMKIDINNMKNYIVNLQNDFCRLDNELHVLRVDLIENNVIPRLSNIEKHYVSTSNRYINSLELTESMLADVSLLKSVVAEHSEILQKYS